MSERVEPIDSGAFGTMAPLAGTCQERIGVRHPVFALAEHGGKLLCNWQPAPPMLREKRS